MKNQSKLSSLEILLSISRELTTSLDLHTVLERVLTLSTSNIGAERASLIILDEKGTPTDAVMILNGKLTPTTVEQIQDVITSGLAGWVIRNKQYALLNDAEKDERWLSRPLANDEVPSGKSALCMPIMARDKLIGVLTIVHSRVNFFSDENLALQQAIADIAGIAIHNAGLYKDVQNTRARYYELFEESLDPIFITDLHGKILEANHEASHVTGVINEKLLNLVVNDLHSPATEKIGQNFELIPSEGSLTYKSNLKLSSGILLPVEVHVSQITISGVVCLQWIFRDLQEQKQLDKMRDDLSAMLYHDLRSPLANIISSLDIMANLLPSTESDALKSVFNVARRSTERMQRMIDGLLDINRFENNEKITKKQITKISSIISDAIDIIQPTAQSKQINIKKLLEKEIPDVVVDTEMIRRVVVNLLENAVKFSPEGSTVRIGAKKIQQEIQIWVDDQGMGIPESARKEIFEKFVRLQQNYPAKGLGLGLAFCKLAVQAHGGTIWVENIPQSGSRFIFSLPLIHQD